MRAIVASSCAQFAILVLLVSLPILAQTPLPPLKDGTVTAGKGSYRHDGPLHIDGHIKIQGIDLELRGQITLAARDPLVSPTSIRQMDSAAVSTQPALPVEKSGKER